MAQQQSKLEYDDDDALAGFQIVCCPVELNRSSSEAPPNQTLPSSSSKIAPSTAVEVEDTPAPVQLSGSRTTSLQRPSSFQRSISLHREPSHPTTPNDEEQPNINVQRSTSQASRGGVIAIHPSRSRSFANSQHGSVNDNEEQPDINVQRSTSQSQTGHVDDIAIHPFQSQSHHSNSQHDSINEEDFAVVTTSIPYGQEEEQDGVQVIEPRQRRQRRRRNKCATAAILCVCLGVCAGLVVLFISTDTLIQQSLQRNGSLRDYDGDGLSDELELLMGTDPLNADENGNGIIDGEELVAKVAKTKVTKSKVTKSKVTKSKVTKSKVTKSKVTKRFRAKTALKTQTTPTPQPTRPPVI